MTSLNNIVLSYLRITQIGIRNPFLGIIVLLSILCGCGDQNSTKNNQNFDIKHYRLTDQSPALRNPNQNNVARLNVTGTDGTAELQKILANELTQGEIVALGLGVVFTGGDTYAARIRISNTGTVPINFFPENLAVHFGREAVGVTTINHPRFLQRGLLQPNRFFEGLVMYRARIDIGAAMRLAGGGLSYNDDTIEVTYNR